MSFTFHQNQEVFSWLQAHRHKQLGWAGALTLQQQTKAVITSMSTDVAGWQADREADRQAGRQILYTSPLGIVCFEHSFSEWQTQIDLGGPAADPLNLIRMFSHTQI